MKFQITLLILTLTTKTSTLPQTPSKSAQTLQKTAQNLPRTLSNSLNTSEQIAITNNLNPQPEDEFEGSDLRTQLMKSTLDFTDDLTVIIKRVLMQRESLKHSKGLSAVDANSALYAGASYKGYDQTPQVNRPQYSQVYIKNQSQQNGIVDEERKLLGFKKNGNFRGNLGLKKGIENLGVEKEIGNLGLKKEIGNLGLKKEIGNLGLEKTIGNLDLEKGIGNLGLEKGNEGIISGARIVKRDDGFKERKLWDLRQGKEIIKKYMEKREFEDSEIEKPLKHFDPEDMYKIASAEMKAFNKKMMKKKIVL